MAKIDASTEAVLGNGSCHYLRDMGDANKLVKALLPRPVGGLLGKVLILFLASFCLHLFLNEALIYFLHHY